MDILTSQYFMPAAITAGTGIVLWILRKIPNKAIYGAVHGTSEKLGVMITLGLSKWKWTRHFWNRTIEPWFIDLLENIVHAFITGLIKGLRSDNTE